MRITLKLAVPDEAAAQDARNNLQGLMRSLRLDATPQVLTLDGRPFKEILHQSSRGADLVFLGMATPHEGFSGYYEGLQALTSGLPTTLIALASPDFQVQDVLTST